MAKPHRRDLAKELFWRQMVHKWLCSGLTIRDFCRKNDLTEGSFYAWRRTIAERDQEGPSFSLPPQGNSPPPSANTSARTSRQSSAGKLPLFVPVTVAASTIPTPAASTNPPSPPTAAKPIEVVLSSGRLVRVPVGFDGGTLREILSIIESAGPGESLESPSC